MPNGDGPSWQAINELRKRAERNSERISIMETRMSTFEAAILASEKRMSERMDDLEATITSRLDRTRNTALALLAIAVPLISALAGALLQSV